MPCLESLTNCLSQRARRAPTRRRAHRIRSRLRRRQAVEAEHHRRLAHAERRKDGQVGDRHVGRRPSRAPPSPRYRSSGASATRIGSPAWPATTVSVCFTRSASRGMPAGEDGVVAHGGRRAEVDDGVDRRLCGRPPVTCAVVASRPDGSRRHCRRAMPSRSIAPRMLRRRRRRPPAAGPPQEELDVEARKHVEPEQPDRVAGARRRDGKVHHDRLEAAGEASGERHAEINLFEAAINAGGRRRRRGDAGRLRAQLGGGARRDQRWDAALSRTRHAVGVELGELETEAKDDLSVTLTPAPMPPCAAGTFSGIGRLIVVAPPALNSQEV